jgi:hypothetical protein
MQLLAACGAPDPKFIAPPLNALLYVSGTSEGIAEYKCGPDGKPTQTPISVDGTFVNPEGWVGSVFRNKDGFLQFDLGLYQNQTKRFVNSTVVLENKDAVFQPIPNALPFGRWAVLSNDGEGPPLGLVDMAYVTRIDTEGGAPGTKNCKPGETVKSDYKATYNMYTCEEAYLPPIPAPGATPIPDVPAPIPAPAPAPAAAPIAPIVPIVPIVVPTVLAPVPAPVVAAAPVSAPVPAVVPAAVVPAAAPPSGAVASGKAVAIMTLFFSAAFMLA